MNIEQRRFLPRLADFPLKNQCFDTVGLVIWLVKIVPEMTYYVSSGTLNPTHSLIPELELN